MKTMTEDVKKRTWFKYYRGIDDFILEAMRKSMEDWEKCALARETEKESDATVEATERPRPVSAAHAKEEQTEILEDSNPQGCSHYVGYLMKEHPRKTPIPNECITCEKINQCLLRDQ